MARRSAKKGLILASAALLLAVGLVAVLAGCGAAATGQATQTSEGPGGLINTIIVSGTGKVTTPRDEYSFPPLAPSVLEILESGGLVTHVKRKLGLA